jgi:hypothetical protein
LIDDALGTATTELADIRDNQMEQIVQLVHETISMQRLLGGTGLSRISNPEFWQILVNIVGGGYLDRMVETLEEVERQLTERAGEAVDSKAMQRLQRVQAECQTPTGGHRPADQSSDAGAAHRTPNLIISLIYSSAASICAAATQPIVRSSNCSMTSTLHRCCNSSQRPARWLA